jgi:hypothetical protein
MWQRLISGALLATLVAPYGCAQRYQVPSPELMRGDVIENVHVTTADGYEYDFEEGGVRGDTFYGILIEEVEQLDTEDEIYISLERREVPIPISTVIGVEGTKQALSPNNLYLLGAIGAGAVVVGALSGVELSDIAPRGSGNASKPIPR